MEYARLDQIQPNPNQPRTYFDTAKMVELAVTIRENGIIQPITVQSPQNGDGIHYLIDGERRWRASCALAIFEAQGYEPAQFPDAVKTVTTMDAGELIRTYRDILEFGGDIPVSIADRRVNNNQQLVQAIVANEQHQSMTPIELARAYDSLINDHKYSVADVATMMGASKSAISNTRRLLKLPEPVTDLIANGELSARHGRALLPLVQVFQWEQGAIELAKVIVLNNDSVRAAERRVETLIETKFGNARITAASSIIHQQYANDLPEPCQLSCMDCPAHVGYKNVVYCIHPNAKTLKADRIHLNLRSKPITLQVWHVQNVTNKYLSLRFGDNKPARREWLEGTKSAPDLWINHNKFNELCNALFTNRTVIANKNTVVQAINNLTQSARLQAQFCPKCQTKQAVYDVPVVGNVYAECWDCGHKWDHYTNYLTEVRAATQTPEPEPISRETATENERQQLQRKFDALLQHITPYDVAGVELWLDTWLKQVEK